MTSNRNGAERAAGSAGGALRQGRKKGTLILVGVLFAFGLIAGSALGVWQVQRRAWKLDLIERVEERVHRPAVTAPGPAEWPEVSRDRDEYRHVTLSGRFLNDRETYVQAVTELGGGFWVMTPLLTGDGQTVLINRGFVPPERKMPDSRSAGLIEGPAVVTGLLRLDEPGGAFLRSNDPTAGRFYSRDLQAIAEAKGLGEVAPYFIDADARPNPGGFPVGGLTQVRFHNSHLVYAITWFTLAAMCLAGLIMMLRSALGRRSGP